MDVDNLKLILEIQKRRSLWTKFKDYNDMQWQHVANEVNVSGKASLTSLQPFLVENSLAILSLSA